MSNKCKNGTKFALNKKRGTKWAVKGSPAVRALQAAGIQNTIDALDGKKPLARHIKPIDPAAHRRAMLLKQSTASPARASVSQ